MFIYIKFASSFVALLNFKTKRQEVAWVFEYSTPDQYIDQSKAVDKCSQNLSL